MSRTCCSRTWEISIRLGVLAHFQITHESGLPDIGNSYLKVLLKSWWAELPLCTDSKWKTSLYSLHESKLKQRVPTQNRDQCDRAHGKNWWDWVKLQDWSIVWRDCVCEDQKWSYWGGEKSLGWLSHEKFPVEGGKVPVHFLGLFSPSSSVTSWLWHRALGLSQRLLPPASSELSLSSLRKTLVGTMGPGGTVPQVWGMWH